MEKTGWPPPALMQDDHRKLFQWFASKPGARLLVRMALLRPGFEQTDATRPLASPGPQGFNVAL